MDEESDGLDDGLYDMEKLLSGARVDIQCHFVAGATTGSEEMKGSQLRHLKKEGKSRGVGGSAFDKRVADDGGTNIL